MAIVAEGDAAEKWVRLIKQIGANTDVLIEFGTVTAAPPNLRVKVDGMRVELEADDVVIAEHLTEYTRTVTIDGGNPVTMTVDGALKLNDRVILAQIENGLVYVILDRKGAL